MVDFDKLYENILHPDSFMPGNSPDLRASGAPFCPKRFIFDYKNHLDGNSRWDYFGSFYCDIGTAIHSAIQFWIPRVNKGYLFGNWKCHHCKILINHRVGPLHCPKCNDMMEYREIIIKFKDAPLVGHSDGLLLDKNYIVKKYGEISIEELNDILIEKSFSNSPEKIPAWVLELKSTGMYKAKSLQAPQNAHRGQASLYALAIQRMPEFEKLFHVKGFIVKYISRDNPRIRSKDLKIEVKDDSIYEDTCYLINKIVKMLRTQKIKKVNSEMFCESYTYFDECDYKELCKDIDDTEFKLMVSKVSEDWFKKPINFIKKYSLFGD